MDTREYRNNIMPEVITEEELKEAIEQWAPKFNLIRELWPGASIEESLKLMAVIETKADEIKEDKKKTMGFGPFIEKEKSKSKVQAKRLSHTEEVREFDLKQGKTIGKLKKRRGI